jgi:PAS domain S-box-containing protein
VFYVLRCVIALDLVCWKCVFSKLLCIVDWPSVSLPFIVLGFDSIIITDASNAGLIVYANLAFKKLTGYEPSEAIGQSPKILQGTGTDAKVIQRLTTALKTGGTFEGKAINYRKDGTPFIMFWRVLPITVGGEINYWVAIQRVGVVAL